MRDQAESLRRLLNHMNQKKAMKAIAVVSGKGGVGKSNFSLNFALTLSKRGFHVLLFDMDIGMGNIDILLGQSTSTTIIDLFESRPGDWPVCRNRPVRDRLSAAGAPGAPAGGGAGLPPANRRFGPPDRPLVRGGDGAAGGR